MLILVGTLLAIVLVPVLGGSLAGLSGLTLRRPALVAAALGLQILSISIVPHWPRPLLVFLHGGSYVLAACFLWVNRRLPGLLLVALGGGMNALAIALNGGQMPGSPTAFARAGLPLEDEGFVNSGVLEDPRLAFLGDVFASPSWLPLRNVYSVGDLLILAGAVWAVHRTCRSVLARDPRPALRRALQVEAPACDHDDRDRLELQRERDEALAEVARTGRRNEELAREVTRLRQDPARAAVVPQQPERTAHDDWATLTR